ncbi:uncharacterized protein LOC131145695 [Malania oleifera]|uniref:uncharacterized protein LOC131145695 n=1 Tax=Malania oleifera TaxID=397392 RepID=UPI0025AE7CAC|nr:uncharacterized protein LOC131145695 [Malania oleifera]
MAASYAESDFRLTLVDADLKFIHSDDYWMNPRSSSAHTQGDDRGPSSMGGRDQNVVLRSITQQVRAKMARGSQERSCTIEQFMRIRPPSFFGGAVPLMAKNWVQDIDEMMAVLPRTNEQKVLFATFKLIDEAKGLWRSTKLLEEQTLDPITLTWNHFWEIFFERYFPSIVRSVKAVEFLHLTQGPMTI